MDWPAPSDYHAAVQNPRSNFADPDLRSCSVVKTALGLPKVASGMFASVYELRSATVGFAVRCFTRPVTDQQRRYNLISQCMAGLVSPYLVNTQFLNPGLRVQRQWFPIVKMSWVEGKALQLFVEEALDYPGTLLDLARQLRALIGQLQGLRMAHGDLQHGNILVTPQHELKLVDYDGMFVPAMRGERAPELGHANFQHPRRQPWQFDERLDDFSALVILLSLRALARNKGLWTRHHNGDNLILRKQDLEHPRQSAVFCELIQSPDRAVRQLAEKLRSLCGTDPNKVPPLEEVLSGLPAQDLFPNDLQTQRRPQVARGSPFHTHVPIVPPQVVPKQPPPPPQHPVPARPARTAWDSFVASAVALLAVGRQRAAVLVPKVVAACRHHFRGLAPVTQPTPPPPPYVSPVPATPFATRDQIFVLAALLIAAVSVALGVGLGWLLWPAKVGPRATTAPQTPPDETENAPNASTNIAPGQSSFRTESQSYHYQYPRYPFTNTLGMVFMPVPDRRKPLFSVWETRVQDYEPFASATERLWGETSFSQGPTHPAVNVSWHDAQAFCEWLTSKERAEGRLSTNQEYRLPTDAEWSVAVGLPREAGATPRDKDRAIGDVYPWGSQWPPPERAGNYADESSGLASRIAGYHDSYAQTAPVGSFQPNNFALYDLGGNVWEWCEDYYDHQRQDRVLRGGSWNVSSHAFLLSSGRRPAPPAQRGAYIGFRVVLLSWSEL